MTTFNIYRHILRLRTRLAFCVLFRSFVSWLYGPRSQSDTRCVSVRSFSGLLWPLHISKLVNLSIAMSRSQSHARVHLWQTEQLYIFIRSLLKYLFPSKHLTYRVSNTTSFVEMHYWFFYEIHDCTCSNSNRRLCKRFDRDVIKFFICLQKINLHRLTCIIVLPFIDTYTGKQAGGRADIQTAGDKIGKKRVTTQMAVNLIPTMINNHLNQQHIPTHISCHLG